MSDRYQVKLLARLLENGRVAGAYERDIELPFIPLPGLCLEKRGIWEGEDGERFAPEIERVFYDLDESVFVCVCTVPAKIGSHRPEYWEERGLAELGDRERYFRGM